MRDVSNETERHNRRAARLRFIRQLHLWVAVFVAPSLMLFAVTGMLQLFKLHEAEGGYRPPPVIEKLGQVHIHQKYALRPVRRPSGAQPAPAASAPARGEAEAEEPAAPLGETLTRWTFLVMSLGMAMSAVLGVWMSLSNTRQRRTTWLLLAAGTVLPILVLAL
ncbi:MAG TPA: hypothetical protein PLO65_16125 [Caulobacter sp.]|nr:hypothetical protein [Caulobacter sp.]